MSRTCHESTADELARSFERSLQLAIAGMIRTCSPLDSLTLAALRDLARAFPAADRELVKAARDAFAGQLAGRNSDDCSLPEFMC
ncbi:hypothetical protein [Nocardia asteroides]|uniref:hypothetical protein n=1 Tax=Nocardia asteroides TaxID=1824 RepID=UPI001E3614E1|nr:hypothetical protein [Nocardia asteroides]UGT57228.1 hypothetical protein LTT85_10450 [Nocardia asteroides]